MVRVMPMMRMMQMVHGNSGNTMFNVIKNTCVHMKSTMTGYPRA